MIFIIKVTTNKEERAVDMIAEKVGKKELNVYSVSRPHGLRGYVFLEAEDKDSAEEAVFNLPYVKGIIGKTIGYKEDFLMHSLPYSKADLHGPRIILPTKRHVEKSNMGFSRYEWRLVDGEIQIPDFEFYSFDVDGERTWPKGMIPFGRHGGNMNSRRELLIKIGSKDVTDYFKSKRSLYHDDFSYVRALKLLGIEDQAPGEFVIGYTEEIGEEKGDTLTRIIELLEKQGLSRSRIKRIYKIAEIKGVLSEGGAITPIDDKDDAFVVSMGSREKLNESTRQLISTLERAVELGMHDEDLIIDGEIPGQSLDAKTLIRTLCKQYEVSYN